MTSRLPSKGEPGAGSEAAGDVAPTYAVPGTAGNPVPQRALLAELAREPDGISLPRLCKRLGWRMSVLMRELAWLGEASIGGQPGPGLVRVERRGDRDIAVLVARENPDASDRP